VYPATRPHLPQALTDWFPRLQQNFTFTDSTQERTVSDRIMEGESNKENQLSGKQTSQNRSRNIIKPIPI